MTKRTGDENKMVEWDFHFYCKQFIKIKSHEEKNTYKKIQFPLDYS